MDVFSSWLAKTALTQTANAIWRRCVDSGLLPRCAARAEEWRRQLPPGATLHSIDMFFRSDSANGIDNLPPGPKNVLTAIERGNVPTGQMWFGDLLTQWKWVRDNVEEPTDFFTLEEQVAQTHLNTLANILYGECSKDAALFQQDALKKLTSIEDEVREIRQAFAEQAPSRARLPTEATAETMSCKSGSAYHSEIEAACAHIKQGHPQLTLAVLATLEKQSWPNLSQHERYRLVANRGIAKMESGDVDSAARDFIACVQYEPDEEKPRCWAANGHLILGDREKCASLVQGILADFPESTFAYALRVYSAPADAGFSELEGLVPEHHRDDSDVAMALSERAAAGRLMEIAETYARAACKGDGQHPKATMHLGTVIVESTIQRARPLLSDSPPVDEVRLQEGLTLLRAALKDFESRSDDAFQAECHFHIGRAHHFLGDEASSRDELKAAYTSTPSEPRFCTQYALSLYDDGQEEESIALLEEASSRDSTLNAAVIAGQLLYARSADGDLTRATQLLEAARHMLPGSVPSANIEFVGILTDVYCATGRKQDAIDTIQELTEAFEEVEKQVLLAAADRKSGDIESAKSRLASIINTINGDTDIWTRHLVATELLFLELYHDAFTILRVHVPDKCMSLDTKGLVFAAQRCEHEGFLIDFLSRLRMAGVFEPQFIDLELGLLEKYHAIDHCLEVLQRLLQDNAGDEEFRRELRIRTSFLGLVYGATHLVERDVSRLPRADSTTAQIGFLVVLLLTRLGEFEKARDYAYSLLRCNYESKHAHQALIGSFLFERNAPVTDDPETVAPGTAFYYEEDGVPDEKWVILEDDPSPNMDRGEYPPTHHGFKNAIGKKVGERFTVKDSGFQQVEGTILRINDKKVLRFNICIQQYDQRFGDGFLVQIRIPKDEAGNLDLEPIRKAAKQRADAIAERDELYRTYPLSVASYATLSQTSVVDVIGHMANTRLPIRCCAGNEFEEAKAFEVLNHDARLVLDPSAVATLVHTKTYDLLKTTSAKLIVPLGLIVRLKAEIENSSRFSGNGTLSYIDSRLVYEEVTEEQKQQWIDLLTETVAALESCCEVVNGLPLAQESPNLRSDWSQLFGWDTAEAIAITKHHSASIWTDDRMVSIVAAEQTRLDRVWTEVVFKWASSRNEIPYARFIEVVADLVRFGYWHTKLFPDAAEKMAEDAEWDFRRQPFKATIEWIGSAGVSADAIRVLAETLLPRIYGTQSELINSATVQTILGSIGRRRDGRRIIRELRRRVGFYCGLDFIIEQRLTDDYDTWLRVGNSPSIT